MSFFRDIPQEYDLMRKRIGDSLILKIYSLFSYQYAVFQRKSPNDNNSTFIQKKEDFLVNYLKEYCFFTYQIVKHKKDNVSNNIFISDMVICVENKCIIIESIDNSIIKNIILKLEKFKLSSINVDLNQSKSNSLIQFNRNEEIYNFCVHYFKLIKSNKFVNMTLRSLIGFLITRYFYPTKYFKDQSFFKFDQLNENIENQTNFDTQHFNRKDFIYLRKIYSNECNLYYLALHIKTLYIFMVKEIIVKNDALVEHESYFCKNYRHPCFVPFYGFL